MPAKTQTQKHGRKDGHTAKKPKQEVKGAQLQAPQPPSPVPLLAGGKAYVADMHNTTSATVQAPALQLASLLSYGLTNQFGVSMCVAV